MNQVNALSNPKHRASGTVGNMMNSSELPWFMHANAREILWALDGSDEIKLAAESFIKNGYLVIPKSISEDICDGIVEKFKTFQEKNKALFFPHLDEMGHYPRMVNFHLVMDCLLESFLLNAKTLRLTDFLFQKATSLYTSLFYERGSSQDIHRDTPYFTTRPEYNYFGVWVAFENTDSTNGPLCVVPGGHLVPELCRSRFALNYVDDLNDVKADSMVLWDAYQRTMFEECQALGLTTKNVEVKKGDTILWHPQLPHGGAAIKDFKRTRFSLVMHVTPENTPVYHQNAFFNPDKALATTAPWSTVKCGNWGYAKHETVSFAHQAEISINDFK